MIPKYVPAGALTVLLAFGAAHPLAAKDSDAQQRGPDFATLDTDGDGSITADELRARGDARFAAADADGDGLVSAEEMIARATSERAERIERRVQRLIEARDENGDGALSREELGDDRVARMLERVDRDEDGLISEEEFEEAQARFDRRDRDARRGYGDGRGDAPRN